MSLLSKLLFFGVCFFILTGLLVGCKSESSNDTVTKDQKTFTMQSILTVEQENNIPTGIPITVTGKRIYPDSIRSPAVIAMGSPQSVPAHQNRQIAKAGIRNVIDEKHLQIITPNKDNLIITRPLVVDIKKVPAIHNPAIPALPPRFKDNAVYDIRYLDVEQGLNGSDQKTICQTQAGYLWFGSSSGGGICRYDGKSFVTFMENEGLVYSEVNDIVEDRQQNLWIATKQGLSKYDGYSFTNFMVDIDFNIINIMEDSMGNVWLTTLNDSLLKYDGTDFLEFVFTESCFEYSAESIVERNGQIWIGTHCGLFRYDGVSFTRFVEEDGLANRMVNQITKGKNNNLWLATDSGFSKYDGKSFTNFSLPESFNDPVVLNILEDKSGLIWLGTEDNGLIQYDGKYFTCYRTNEGLTDNSITDLLEDNTGQLWVSTYNGGINRFKITTAFQHLTKEQGLSDDVIVGIYEDQTHNMWYATYANGLIKYDGQKYWYYNSTNGLKYTSISAIAADRNGHLWLGNYDDIGTGISKFDGQSFTYYEVEQGFDSGIVWFIMEDSKGQIWFATDNGVFVFDGTCFTQFTEEEGLIYNYTTHIDEDDQGNILIATELGWSKYDGTSFVHYTTKEGLVSNSTWCSIQDSRGFYWIGTYNGLSIFNGTDFYTFTKQQGLENEQVLALQEDHLGNIWLGTKSGIYLFEIPNGDQATFEDLKNASIEPFHIMDGLKVEDIDLNRVFFDTYHNMWWGSGKALTRLNLDQFYKHRNQNIPTLQWNTLQLNEHYVDFINYDAVESKAKIGDFYFAESNLANQYPTDLEVAYDINHFTFNLIGFDWVAPHRIKYQYQLEGLEDKWSQPTASNEVDYRSIPPGNYTFKVKAAGQANIWSDPIAYNFTVLPPWWLTWWAYLIYSLLVLTLLYAIFSFFRNRLILENKLEREAEESQRLQELDSFKSRLITNLTHEFRTPLTVILGMADQIETKPEKYVQKGTQLIKNNGKNLLRLINQLLDLSKLEDQSFKLHLKQGDIVAYLAYLIESFHSYAKSKEIALRFSPAVETLFMDYDAEQIKQIINNLISNAIKFTPAQGQVLIQVSTNNEQLIIEVQDSGIGISPEHLPYIFDRFYQISTTHKFIGSGTGIGLAHTQELVQLMGGKIMVTSQVQVGTNFQVYLPIQQRVILKKEISNGIGDLHAIKKPFVETEVFKIVENKDCPQLLIVEDNPDVMTYIKSCLEDLYELHFAHNGAIGIEKALEHIPDLIISDVMMPEKNGYELCDFLKNDDRTSHIPIILLTAKADASSKMEGLSKGADVYLSKPFDKAELLLRLEKMTQRQQKLKDYFSKNINSEVPIVSEKLDPEEKELVQIEHAFIEKVKKIIDEHYSNEQFALPDLCEKLNISRTQLYRKMKALIDVSPSQFIRSYRLQQGKILIETTDLSVAEVAWRVGFKERSHFSKSFNDEFGFYPTSFNK